MLGKKLGAWAKFWISKSWRQRVLHGVGLAAFVLAGSTALAAVDTWSPASATVNWGTASNWVSGVLPASGDALIFASSGSGGAALIDNLMTPSTYNISGGTFTSSAAAYTINPAAAGTNGFTLTGALTNSSTNLQTVNDAIILSGTRTVTMTAGGGNVALGGNISGAGGAITLAGAGLLSLTGSNTFTGGITLVSAGSLQLQANAGNTTSGTTAVMPAQNMTVQQFPSGATIQLLADSSVASGGIVQFNNNGSSQTFGANSSGARLSGTLNFNVNQVSNDSNLTLQFGNSAATWIFGSTTSGTTTINVTGGNGYTLQLGNGTLGNNEVMVFNPTTANMIVGGLGNSTAPTGNVYKTGAGTLTITGSSNYSGTTIIGTGGNAAGALQVTASQALGTGTIQFDTTGNGANGQLWLNSTLGISLPNALAFPGRNNTVPSIENIAGPNVLSGAIAINAGGVFYGVQSDAGLLTLGAVGSTAINSAATGARTFTLQGAGNGAVVGNILNGSAGSLSLTKAGTGTWTLNGNNTYTGITTVAAGILAIANTGKITAANMVIVGNTGGAAAAIYQSGSSLVTNTSTAGGAFALGNSAGAAGYYNLSGGTINLAGEIDVGGLSGGANTFAQFDMTGGVVNMPNSTSSYFLANRGLDAGGEANVINVSGGTVQILGGGTPATSGLNGLAANWNTTGSAQSTTITISGSAQFLTPSLTVKLNQGDNFTGINGSSANVTNLNLNGGTLQTLGFLNGTNNNAGVSIDFNGGYLKAGNAANSSFLANLGAAYVNSGGGTIDNNGQNITIGQALLAPSGSGIAIGTTGVSYSSGFTVPPEVTLVGTGSGATAYVTINQTTGAITGFVVTNPGVGYTSAPSVVLTTTSGTSTLSPSVWTPTMTANPSGGLTFAGTGATTLAGANTYTGNTSVNAGMLLFNGTSTGGGNYAIASGATLGGSGTITGGTVTINSGATLAPDGNSSPAAGSLFTFTPPSLVLSNGVSASFNLSGTNTTAGFGSNDLVNVTNSLSLAGATSVYVKVVDNGGAFQTSGTSVYELFSYGSLSGFTSSSFTLSDTGILNSRQKALFVNNSSQNQIDLDVIGVAGNLTWVGSNGASWNVSGGTTNWFNSNSNSLDKFVNGDNVTFAAASAGPPVVSGSGVVSIDSSVAPASVAVSGGDYTLSGSGKITGVTGLTVQFGGALTIANTNDYTGGTQVQGLLALGTNNALPVVNTALSVNGGTLDLAGYNQQVDSLSGYGLITASSGNSTLTYASSALYSYFYGTIADTAPGGGTLGLTISSGTLDARSGTGTNYFGATTVTSGALWANSIPNSSAYTVGPSGFLGVAVANAIYGAGYSNSGAVVFGNTSGTISIPSPTGGGITSTGGAVLNISAGSQGFGGTAALYKAGPGTLVLTGNSTYTGGTTLDQGTIQAAPGSSQPNGPGVGDFVWDNAANSAVLDLNGQNISLGAISQPNASTANVITNSASGTTATLAVGSNGDTTTFSGVLQNGAGTLALATAGGALTLTNTNNYSGGTTIGGGGVLSIPHSYSLPYSPLGFNTAGGTLVAGFPLTAPAMNFSGSATLYAAISAPSVSVTGSAFQLGSSVAGGGSQTLDLTAVPVFAYSASAQSFNVGGAVNGAPATSATMLLAATNTITAASFGVGAFTNENFSAQNTGTLNLGQMNTINANSITVGYNKNVALLQFQPGLTNPALVIRNTAGNGRASLVVATDSSGQQATLGTIDLVTGVTGNSILDAMISSGTIGTTTGGADSSTGTFLMGGGTLDATSLYVGQSQSAASNVGTFSTFGGLVKISALVLGDQHSTGGVTANFTLDGGGTLSATSIALGSVTGGTVSTPTVNFNWNNGTIANYNVSGSTTGLTVSIPTIILAGTGTHTLWIDAGQTGTINAAMNAGGGTVDFIKDGPGTALLTAGGNYTGATNVVNGTLKLSTTAALYNTSAINISSGSFINDSSVVLPVSTVNLNSGVLGGTGTFSSATVTVANSPNNIVAAGDSGSGTLAINSLTFSGSGQISVAYGASLLNATTLAANGPAGSVVIQNTGGFVTTAGEYPLVDYSGTIGGTGSAAFALGALPPRTTAHLDFSNPGVIDYDVTGTDFPVWTGSANSTWSTAAIPNPKNWNLAVAGSATDFLAGDNVLFDDTAYTGLVQISAANVQPASVTFNNNSLVYTITGSYGIADYSASQSTAVTMSGSGLVVFATSNSYTGGTNINGGTLQLGNGVANGSISAASVVNDNSVLAFNPAGSAAFANMISGSGGVEIAAGRVIFTAANQYTGATTINGGTLQLGDGVTAGGVVGSVADNGTLSFNEPTATTFANAVNGTGALTQNGTGTLTLTASNGYTGTTYVNAGVLSVGNGGSGESLASAAIVNNAALVFNHGDALTYSGNISGSGSLTKIGAGTTTLSGNISGAGSVTESGAGELILSGSNNYTGLTTIAGGILNLASATALTGGGNLTFQGGTLLYTGAGAAVVSSPVVNSTATMFFDVASGTLQMAGNLSSSNTAGMQVIGLGTLVLSHSNNYSGTTEIGFGQGAPQNFPYAIVLATASQALGTGTITYDPGGNTTQGRLELANNISLNNPINLGGRNSGTPAIENISGNNTLSGGITVQAGGTYFLQSDAGLLTLSGGTAITSGAGGSRNVNLQGAGNGLISGAVVNGNATSGLSLTMLDSGTWTISNTNNSYTGGTNVNSGVVQFTQVLAMPSSGAVSVAGGAVLAVNAGGPGEFTNATSGSGSIGELLAGIGGQGAPVNWASGAILGIDATNAPAGLTYSGSIGNTANGPLGLEELGSGELILIGTNTYSGGTFVDSGTLIVDSPTALPTGSSLTVGQGASTVLGPAVARTAGAALPDGATAVPEPGTLALVMVAAMVAGFAVRRRRRRELKIEN